MDITHPVYRFYAERVIRELMKRTAHRKCVIGFQVDNETKYYGTSGKICQISQCLTIECDFVWPESEEFSQYKAIFVPALYAASDALLDKLNRYVADGGTLVVTFKTAFANENVKVSHEVQPRILNNCFGVKYHQFTFPKNVGLSGSIIEE